MRGLLIVNPRATTTTARTRDVIAHAFASSIDLDVASTTHRLHATDLARQGRRDGMDVVLALGGDGTVNEIVNGLLSDGPGRDVPVLGTIPGGSANVFARSIGLPDDAVEATGVLLEALEHTRLRTLGLGAADVDGPGAKKNTTAWFAAAAKTCCAPVALATVRAAQAAVNDGPDAARTALYSALSRSVDLGGPGSFALARCSPPNAKD